MNIYKVLILMLLLNTMAFAELNLSIVPQKIKSGSCLTIIISGEGLVSAKGNFLDQNFTFYNSGSVLKGIIGVPCELAGGDFILKVEGTKLDGEKEELQRNIAILGYAFPTTSFWLKPAKKKIMNSRDIVGEEWAMIEPYLLKEDPTQAWQGKFILPSKEGPFSMLFGINEIVNGKKRSQHRGLDIAVSFGTPIKAPNDGRVVFAKNLIAFGGTMIIDHGQGIHTLYFHLSKFLKEPGEEVAKGDVIARSGNSGISSGPHLHWGMSVHNLRVDPYQWVKSTF
ncbi:MAG: M23 family metallopeptidase [Candidatus Margulisiibacteriota bacterium]